MPRPICYHNSGFCHQYGHRRYHPGIAFTPDVVAATTHTAEGSYWGYARCERIRNDIQCVTSVFDIDG
jgi:hypothetical protein